MIWLRCSCRQPIFEAHSTIAGDDPSSQRGRGEEREQNKHTSQLFCTSANIKEKAITTTATAAALTETSISLTTAQLQARVETKINK